MIGETNYFETIDSEDKAYFLGFIVADGSINTNKYRNALIINIHKKDVDILNKFKELIKFEGELHFTNTRPSCQITLTSKN